MVSAILLSVGTSFVDDMGSIVTNSPNIETDIGGTEYQFYEVAGFLMGNQGTDTTRRVEQQSVEPEESVTPPGESIIEQLIEQVSEVVDSDDESPDETSEPLPTVEPTGGDGFALQVGSFRDSRHADSLRASLILQGYNAHIATVRVTSDEVWYRVILGPYSTLADANSAAATLKKQGITAFGMVMREKD